MDSWSVAITKRGSVPLFDVDTHADRFAELAEVLEEDEHNYGPAVSFDEYGYTVRLTTKGMDGGVAIAVVLAVVDKALSRVDLPNLPTVHNEATEVSYLEQQLDEPNYPTLVGVTEAAEILGVSKQRVSELARTDHFPTPLAILAGGPVWSEPTIRSFVGRWQRKPGRPPKDPQPVEVVEDEEVSELMETLKASVVESKRRSHKDIA